MSTWTCNQCGLLNLRSSYKCRACFSYNIDPSEYWQCHSCHLFNKTESNRCCACYMIKKPSYTIGDKWNITKLAKPTSFPILNVFSKLLSWKDKLYTMTITKDPHTNQIRVFMMNHSENNSTTLSNPSTASIDWSFSERIHSHSLCINHELSELYIIFFYYMDIDDYKSFEKGQVCLLIYDLDSHKIKNSYLLNLSALNINLNFFRDIKRISIVSNTKSNSENINIPYEIISNWLRKDNKLSVADFLIPNEIYILVNKFYSFCVRNTLLHLLIFSRTKIHSSLIDARLSHAVIDLEFDTEKVVLINSQILHQHHRSRTIPNFLMIMKHFFNIKIGYESYMVFNLGTWTVNLQNGGIKQTQPLLIRDTTRNKREGTNDKSYAMNTSFNYCAYDRLSIINGDQYSYFLGGSRSWNLHLWCFDKKSKEFIKLYTGKSLNLPESLLNILDQDQVLDMVHFKDELFICIYEERFEKMFMSKRKLSMSSSG